MTWIPNSLGAEPKKIGILVGLLAVAGGAYYYNSSGPSATAPSAATSRGTARPTGGVGGLRNQVTSLTPTAPVRATTRRLENAMADFKPTLKLPEGADVSRIDPVLRLGPLSRLETLAFSGGSRSVFAFGAAPAPPAPKEIAKPKPVPGATAATTSAATATTAVLANTTPAKPAPPPIPLKFYGYVNGAPKRAFFIDGEDIFVAGENELIRSRYRIIRIETGVALVEDTTTKSQESLKLVAELGA